MYCHPNKVVKIPPNTIPNRAPAFQPKLVIPYALPLWFGGKISAIIAELLDTSIDPPIACKILNAINNIIFPDNPHNKDPIVKIKKPRL